MLDFHRYSSSEHTDYRFGFNGQEKDDEVYGSGESYDFGERTYSSRLGRFNSIDPLTHAYPSSTPYDFAQSNPVTLIDVDGEWPGNPLYWWWRRVKRNQRREFLYADGAGGDGYSTWEGQTKRNFVHGQVKFWGGSNESGPDYFSLYWGSELVFSTIKASPSKPGEKPWNPNGLFPVYDFWDYAFGETKDQYFGNQAKNYATELEYQTNGKPFHIVAWSTDKDEYGEPKDPELGAWGVRLMVIGEMVKGDRGQRYDDRFWQGFNNSAERITDRRERMQERIENRNQRWRARQEGKRDKKYLKRNRNGKLRRSKGPE